MRKLLKVISQLFHDLLQNFFFLMQFRKIQNINLQHYNGRGDSELNRPETVRKKSESGDNTQF